jgi:hypothetical protein
MRDDVPRELRLRIALIDQRIELAAADFHERKLRRDEESVQCDQNKNADQVRRDHARSIPLRDQP